MDSLTSLLEDMIKRTDRIINTIKKIKSSQIRAEDQRRLIKATSQAWFNSYKPKLSSLLISTEILSNLDASYKDLLECSDRSVTRRRYLEIFKSVRNELIRLRSHLVTQDPSKIYRSNSTATSPNFSPLISDPKMKYILEHRWEETQKCLTAGAYLAATVMMGSSLEALFIARINHMSDRSPIFKLKSTPLDRHTKKAKQLPEWTLNDFIQVASEMKWIRQSGRQVGTVLREYRNFIHPERELSTGILIEENDAKMFWAVFEQLCSQILTSIK